MAEEKKDEGGIKGWMKALLASVFSLLSGAVLMYVSPLVNNAIKPSKPVANFAHQAQGLNVSFTNRSTGASEGWWDFGDGSALEPYVPDQPTILHTYPRAGTYQVKLSLRNFLGDENERTVPVQLDQATVTLPAIDQFRVEKVTQSGSPAVFRVVSSVKNADLCIWSLGDDRPLEIVNDPPAQQDRYITLKDPGWHTLKLVAVNGKQKAEKAEQVFVGYEDPAAATVVLQVMYDAVEAKKQERTFNIAAALPANWAEPTFRFTKEIQAEPGYQITKADWAKPLKEGLARNVKIEVSPEQTRVRVAGELVKPAKGGPTSWAAALVVTQERKTPVKQQMDPIRVALNVPGSTLVPVPAPPSHLTAKAIDMKMELWDSTKMTWQGARLPNGQAIQLKGKTYRLSATQQGNQIRLDVLDTTAPLRPQTN